ncbi:unnamed protein product [Coregonus sp. 'balchen']|nr:unnamed protein product [Coregonus sp. 'balchen']
MKDGQSTKDSNRLVTATEMSKSDLEAECILSKEKEDKTTCESQSPGLRIQDMWSSGLRIQDVWSSGLRIKDVWSSGLRIQEVWSSGLRIQEVWSSGLRIQEVWWYRPLPMPGVHSLNYLSGGALYSQSQLALAQWERDMTLCLELVGMGGESGDATHGAE